MDYVNNWKPDYEFGQIRLFDLGIAQYALCDLDSHHKFYAAIILGKSSLRCQMECDGEPDDVLESVGNKFLFVPDWHSISVAHRTELGKVIQFFHKKGYKFPPESH